MITSRKNPAVTRFRELNRDRKLREAERAFNIEGVRLCGEAVSTGLDIVYSFVTEAAVRKYADVYEKLRSVCEPEVISDDIASHISDTKTPQGMFITAKMPDAAKKPVSGRLILLDGLQDSGNIGSIIRSCDALGMGGCVLSPDCADIYSPKVVRGAMGSLFRLPCVITPLPCFIAGLQADGYAVYAAVLDKNAVGVDDVTFPEKCAVIIGNEGSGVSAEVINAAGKSIYIPIENAESLNAAAAAAIFCSEMRRKRKDRS